MKIMNKIHKEYKKTYKMYENTHFLCIFCTKCVKMYIEVILYV